MLYVAACWSDSSEPVKLHNMSHWRKSPQKSPSCEMFIIMLQVKIGFAPFIRWDIFMGRTAKLTTDKGRCWVNATCDNVAAAKDTHFDTFFFPFRSFDSAIFFFPSMSLNWMEKKTIGQIFNSPKWNELIFRVKWWNYSNADKPENIQISQISLLTYSCK